MPLLALFPYFLLTDAQELVIGGAALLLPLARGDLVELALAVLVLIEEAVLKGVVNIVVVVLEWVVGI